MSETKTVNDQLCINTVRVLAADVVQGANSGHPGMPMGMAPIAHVMFKKFVRANPSNPKWPNRDRWVLSNGHGCALQYIFLHLTGYKLSMDDLRKFRQLDSLTPGHPESHVTPGVEVTTGPLGQGLANAVGLALGRAHLAAVYNKPGYDLFDNWTYVFAGDGCMQEGVTSEAASLAGHLQVPHLICVYDDNHVSIDGDTDLSFSEDVPKRFQAYGWHTINVQKGGDDDVAVIEAAFKEAREVGQAKPVLIQVRTTIGFGATKQGTEAVHGSALGPDEIKKLKTKFGFDPAKSYTVSDEVYAAYKLRTEGPKAEEAWNKLFAEYKTKYGKEAAELERRFAGKLPDGWKDSLPKYGADSKPNATRNLSEAVLNAFAPHIPEFIGGSADLNPSTKTYLKCSKDLEKGHYNQRNIRYGIREHGMAAINNGLFAYGGIIPYCATFFNFIEYCFPSVRLSAISGFQQIYVMTHDSIGLGEDGPTHQPIEAATLCRATPNVVVIRPAEGNETVGAYIAALENHHGPTVIILTRQNTAVIPTATAAGVAKGGYVIQDVDEKGAPDLIFVATGSELGLAVDAAKKLQDKKRVRVVSMPSTTLFDKQSVEYRRSVLTPGVPVISIEALGVTGWERYAHFSIGMTTFGASAPDKDLFNKFGFTPDKVAQKSLNFLEQLAKQSKDMGVSASYPLPVHFTSAL